MPLRIALIATLSAVVPGAAAAPALALDESAPADSAANGRSGPLSLSSLRSLPGRLLEHAPLIGSSWRGGPECKRADKDSPTDPCVKWSVSARYTVSEENGRPVEQVSEDFHARTVEHNVEPPHLLWFFRRKF